MGLTKHLSSRNTPNWTYKYRYELTPNNLNLLALKSESAVKRFSTVGALEGLPEGVTRVQTTVAEAELTNRPQRWLKLPASLILEMLGPTGKSHQGPAWWTPILGVSILGTPGN